MLSVWKFDTIIPAWFFIGVYTQTPELLHNPAWDKMAGLNALAPIKDRTRLIIGDMLEANLHSSGSYPYWKPDYHGDSILMSFDPVAPDTIGLGVLNQLLAAEGSSVSLLDSAPRCLASGAALGLGANLAENIEVVETSIQRQDLPEDRS